MSDITPDDRRARRSRRALAEALWQLIQQSDWAEISVQMICDRADVARSTFYAHFQTKQDLLDEVFAAGEAALADQAQDGGLDGTLLWLVEHLATGAAFHRRLQGSPAGHAIMTRFRRQMRARFAVGLTAEGHAVSPQVLDFLTGGVFAVLESWMQGGCQEAARPLAQDLAQHMRRGFVAPRAGQFVK
ncbi:MAG: TetR/AcrR family transcriptional regulator [Pseudotabrizicola sp.]|uniref:TetR/AcrR family transcriptional regulator n=1 Tax=Pseudotabrizicola sp. TaxID=2939647 RepID=UPI00271EBE3F|nr:TetR/AcrR family transcriptional regulator [Pseudotabrizicola sp.]MDO8885099.1 TetR/AcrR family transcriptional regulator [Pseudotabrizicola sp.]MDP2081016.1 TetR/AcrR family transcriptional regulator [Pseudotabrizicola sp.]MDZ7573986.1 TetR/AcrR family transcriptional regulator [Pseudotabrizicola sp.]